MENMEKIVDVKYAKKKEHPNLGQTIIVKNDIMKMVALLKLEEIHGIENNMVYL